MLLRKTFISSHDSIFSYGNCPDSAGGWMFSNETTYIQSYVWDADGMIGWNRSLLHMRFYLPGDELRSVYGDRKIFNNQRWQTTMTFKLLLMSNFL